MAVLGVDACRAGWVGVLQHPGGVLGVFGRDLPGLLAACAGLGATPEVVGIDMSIGLPDRSNRRADVLARRFAGPRGASVFPTPVRAVLGTESYADACATSRSLTGRAISRQSFALLPRIAEVDTWVRAAGITVIEVHPEVTFAEMAGDGLAAPKQTEHGRDQRERLLEAQGIAVGSDLLGLGRVAGPDDVLDAAAVSWTARRHLDGRSIPVPDPPEVFSDGWPAAIWR